VGNLAFPPADADNWIVYFMAIAAGLGAAFCMLIPRSAWPKIIAVLVTSAALVWLLIKPFVGFSITVRVATSCIAALALGMTLWWVFVNQLARVGPRVLAPIALAIVSGGGAAVLGDSGLAIHGGFTLGAMTVILITLATVAAFTQNFSMAGGGILAAMIVLVGTIIYAYFNISPEPTRGCPGCDGEGRGCGARSRCWQSCWELDRRSLLLKGVRPLRHRPSYRTL
jgi:hypothetical protein